MRVTPGLAEVRLRDLIFFLPCFFDWPLFSLPFATLCSRRINFIVLFRGWLLIFFDLPLHFYDSFSGFEFFLFWCEFGASPSLG